MRIDKGITKDSLWACMCELSQMQVLTDTEEENISERIEELNIN
jgi:hypothetical protein